MYFCPPKGKNKIQMRVNFYCLASGSSGNCYYLGTDDYGILIDAGIGIRTIKKRLREHDVDMSKLRAVFVTHDHADHIKSVGVLGNKCFLPIYATPEVHKGINKSYCVTEKLSPANIHYIYKEQPQYIEEIMVIAFHVPHDGMDNVGYSIQIGDKNFCFITDAGHITPTIRQYAKKANYLILEANYDFYMLRNGHYPAVLKQRIASENGHLCNDDTATFLSEIYNPNLRYVWLCHLSKDNNRPELAYNTVESKLKENGIIVGKDLQLYALRRSLPSYFHTFP